MKRVRKFTPVSMYDAQGLESWLEDMAKQGLFLKKFGAVWCVFERGAARALRCRVEPVRERDSDDLLGRSPMKELYQDFGWSCTASIGNAMLLFSTEDENAPELHTDPELQSGLWKKLYRRARRSFRFQLFLLAVIIAALCAQLWNGGFILSLITSTTPIMLLCLPLFLFQLPGDWAELQKLALMVKQLEAGVPLDHRTFYPRRRRGELVSLVLALILLLGMFTVQYALPFTGGGIRPLADQTAFPALTLERLEGQALEERGYTREKVVDGETVTVNYSNFSERNHYLLCWNQWNITQTGAIKPDDWHRLEIQWYDLPLSFLSAPLAQELLSDAMGLKSNVWWTSPEEGGVVWTVDYYTHFDDRFLAVAREDRGFQVAAVSRGARAAVVKYTGNGDLADHLDEVMAMVQ